MLTRKKSIESIKDESSSQEDNTKTTNSKKEKGKITYKAFDISKIESQFTKSSGKNSSKNSSSSNTDNEEHHSSSALSEDFTGNWYSTTDDEEKEHDHDHTEKDEGKIQTIIAHREKVKEDNNNGEEEFEYLVKLVGHSYKDSKWVPKSEINNTMLNSYSRKHKNMAVPSQPYYPPQYDIQEYVVGQKNDRYLIKWEGLDYDNLTFETENKVDSKLLEKFKNGNKIPSLEEMFIPPHPEPSKWKAIIDHKQSKKGNKLKSYQMEGLNFLTVAWFNNRNAILADEMGLGKTCQTSVFLNFLATSQKIRGPFLVVVPLSTITHWERELADWTDLKVLSYYGIKDRRKYQKLYEIFYPGTEIPKINVLITTYQFVMRDVSLLASINWRCVVIDEAHRLKNHESKLINCFNQFNIDFKLLLTGTPLQNNIEELWTLLNFLNPDEFESVHDFQEKFGELSESDQVVQLQTILKPLMIRRRKGDVENTIIPLEEFIIECPMTQHQKAYYKSIYEHNIEYLKRGAHKDNNSSNLINISMELRKVCNHPYLIRGAEDQIIIELTDSVGGVIDDEHIFTHESLIRSAGKMILLDKLLDKLKKDGHRVLIFSQMTKMLDILQDYLAYRQYHFERIDGSVRGDLRQKAIDDFNAPDSKDFVFLLCTKAGGVGINLTSADTVIIYDSDWNPQNDIQAAARCHRIGQTKEVKLYRFITSKSYERKMFDTASVKLGLDQALLEQTGKKHHKADLDKLLKLGAYYAFGDDNELEKFNENENIEDVLLKSKRITHQNFSSNSNISYTQFELDESDSQIDLTAPDFWQKYLPDVQEDDLTLDGVSIGERRRIMREGTDPSEIAAATETSSKSSESIEWSRKKLNKVLSNLMKFGWGRWRVIYEYSELNCNLSDVKEACIVLLGWMIKASEEKYPVIESIYTQSKTKETKEFERLFKNFNDSKISCSSGAPKKLSRLDLLYFLNGAVGTCPNLPDEIIVPDIANQKPTDWWTDKDDQFLLHGAWQYGYMNYTDIKFTNKEEQINISVLTSRLRNLIIGYKNNYMKYKENVGNDNLPFNYDTLKLSQEAINKRDHKIIIHYLNYFGFPDTARFKKVANLSNKPDDLISEYIKNIIEFCKGNSESEKLLVDRISRPEKLLQRIDLFEYIRKNKENPDLRIDDTNLYKYIDENGLINLNGSDLIIERFGAENTEVTVLKYLRKVETGINTPTTSQGGFSKRSTLHNYVIPEYEKNDDGTPILPIRINNMTIIKNLGKIVYDRVLFHSNRYIYPVGYEAERMFTSLDDPNDKAWYFESIVDDGGESPIFRVIMKNDKKKRIFEGNAPSKPWTEIVKAIENRKRQLKITANRCLTISGPEMFGLYSPLCLHLIQNMENADKCVKFQRMTFAGDNNNSDNDETDGSSSSSDENDQKDNESNDEQQSSPQKKKVLPKHQAPVKERHEPNRLSTRSNPRRNAAVRANQKLELFFDFSKLGENEKNFTSFSIPEDQLIQRECLDIPVPFSKNPIETAVKRMAAKLAKEMATKTENSTNLPKKEENTTQFINTKEEDTENEVVSEASIV